MPDDPLAVLLNRALTVACSDCSRTRRLLDGTIGINGYELRFQTLPPEEMFRRAFESAEFDISELSASTFLLHRGRGTSPYVGLPAFPSRAFRHDAIYVRDDGGIREPGDLRGKIVGVRNYLNTAALVVRGLLADEYGVAPHEISWRVGDVDDAERKNISLPTLARAADIKALPYGQTLRSELLSGGIDALVHYHPPRGFVPTAGSPFRRLFSDPEVVAQAYFRKTGIFPIMHLVGVRRSLLEQDPSLARNVYVSLVKARDLAMSEPTSRDPPELRLPGLADDAAKSDAAAETDFWPYGVRKNETALTSLIRYAFDQGLIDRPLAVAELFSPDLLDT